MKRIRNYIALAVIALIGVSCENELDPIKEVKPGQDVEGPSVIINFPAEGKNVRVASEEEPVTFNFTATDDVEIKEVTIELDGAQVGTITAFKDYRNATLDFKHIFNNGDHTITVTVVDMQANSATTSRSFKKVTAPPYTPMDGEVLYLPFEGDFMNLISGEEAVVEGSPSFVAGKVDEGYQGAEDSFLTFPSEDLVGDEISIAFWANINSSPDRAGIISISPTAEDRTVGLRLFREGTATEQKLGLNVGIGTTEVWVNPFYTFAPDGSWMHVAITISTSKVTCYINGAEVLTADLEAQISWAGTSELNFGSGAPNFVYWEHFSDLSQYDELKIFNRAITPEEVATLASDEK